MVLAINEDSIRLDVHGWVYAHAKDAAVRESAVRWPILVLPAVWNLHCGHRHGVMAHDYDESYLFGGEVLILEPALVELIDESNPASNVQEEFVDEFIALHFDETNTFKKLDRDVANETVFVNVIPSEDGVEGCEGRAGGVGAGRVHPVNLNLSGERTGVERRFQLEHQRKVRVSKCTGWVHQPQGQWGCARWQRSVWTRNGETVDTRVGCHGCGGSR